MSNLQSVKSALSSFFTFIGVITAGLLFCIVALIGYFAVQRDDAHQRSSAVVAEKKQAQASGDHPAFMLGDPEKLNRHMVMRLTTRTAAKFSSYSYESFRALNYLFLDQVTGEAHWLWKKPPFPVVLHEYRQSYDKKRPRLSGILAAIAYADTSGDGSISTDDVQTLAFIKDDGKTVVELVKDVSLVNSVTPLENGELLLVYERLSKAYSALYTPGADNIRREKEIPQLLVR